MLAQLLLAKRTYFEASKYIDSPDAFHAGMAISLLQDSVEFAVWALIKKMNVSVKDQTTFTAQLDQIEKEAGKIPQKAKLLELNKARVGFKHYGNLPATSEPAKFSSYVEDFLRDISLGHFQVDFTELSMVDLLPDGHVRAHLKSAEEFIAQRNYGGAVKEASIAKALILAEIERVLPSAERLGTAFEAIPHWDRSQSGAVIGRPVQAYLASIREAVIASLLRVPLADLGFIARTTMFATQSHAGTWQVVDPMKVEYSEAICRRQVSCLVDLRLRSLALNGGA